LLSKQDPAPDNGKLVSKLVCAVKSSPDLPERLRFGNFQPRSLTLADAEVENIGDDLAKARRLDRGLRDRARGWTDDGPARASTPGLV
jgi:hypothetical protein